MIGVLVSKITERIEYTFDFVFGMRGIEYTLITDSNELNRFDHVLNYSIELVEGVKTIRPAEVLYSDQLVLPDSEVHDLENVSFHRFNGIEDPIASIFFVLSRMEEYVVQDRDAHGRFPFAASLLSELGWVNIAVCDRWADYLLNDVLGLKWENTESVNIIPTFDIDNTFAYKFKTGSRRFLSIGRDLLQQNKSRLKERKNVENGGEDPYDTFDIITSVSERFPNTKLFWLVKSGEKFDRNLSIENEGHRQLIRDLSKSMDINIHPSYSSFQDQELIRDEVKSLEVITNKKIDSSRQHYLRMSLPESYEVLIRSGIIHDYTMGFAEQIGFRSGTARPHHWFNLKTNKRTELLIHPFVYMDGTLNEYLELNIEESKKKIDSLYSELLRYGGDFVFIWHNETIGDYGIWKGWKDVLDHTLNLDHE
jgi:hypothetical protein